MRRLSKYLAIAVWLVYLFQANLFAQLNSNYEGKNVKILLKNGRSLSGKVVKQTEDKVKLGFNDGNISIDKDDIEKVIVIVENAGEKNIADIPSGINITYRFFWARVSGMPQEIEYPIVRMRCTNNSNKEINNIDFKVVFASKSNKEILSEAKGRFSNLPPGYSKTIDFLCEEGYGLLDLYVAKREIYAEVFINNKFYKKLVFNFADCDNWHSL